LAVVERHKGMRASAAAVMFDCFISSEAGYLDIYHNVGGTYRKINRDTPQNNAMTPF